MNTDDTIVAISTPAGRGGLGVVRLSGPDAMRIAQQVLRRPVGESREETEKTERTDGASPLRQLAVLPVDQCHHQQPLDPTLGNHDRSEGAGETSDDLCGPFAGP